MLEQGTPLVSPTSAEEADVKPPIRRAGPQKLAGLPGFGTNGA